MEALDLTEAAFVTPDHYSVFRKDLERGGADVIAVGMGNDDGSDP